MTRLAIGVVVVNWNGCRDTVTCLESLLASEPGPARIVVVDNGSTDDSATTLAGWIEDVSGATVSPLTLLSSGTNRGFAGGANLGIAALLADSRIGHFLLLNNDATVRPDFFAELDRALEAVPDAAIVGATIYESRAGRGVWYAGGSFLPLRALVLHHHEVPHRDTAVLTEFVTGCVMLVSRRALAVLGLLPECYFMYLEDAEYSLRARAAGLPVVYAPRAVAFHAVGAAVERAVQPPQLAYWVARGRGLFVRRNFHGWQRWGALIYLTLTKPGRALVETLAGRAALAWAILRGTAEGLLSKDGELLPQHSRAAEGADDGVVVDQ